MIKIKPKVRCRAEVEQRIVRAYLTISYGNKEIFINGLRENPLLSLRDDNTPVKKILHINSKEKFDALWNFVLNEEDEWWTQSLHRKASDK